MEGKNPLLGGPHIFIRVIRTAIVKNRKFETALCFDHFCHLVIRVCFGFRISNLLPLSHPRHPRHPRSKISVAAEPR